MFENEKMYNFYDSSYFKLHGLNLRARFCAKFLINNKSYLPMIMQINEEIYQRFINLCCSHITIESAASIEIDQSNEVGDAITIKE